MIPTMTLSRFINLERKKYPESTGELSDLLSSIALAMKMISQIVATAGFKGLYGYTGKNNVQGERVHVLDEEADSILVTLLGASGHFGLLVSEERDSVIATESSHKDAHYIVAFDPLDGSSNIGSNIPVGTIFSILRKKERERGATTDDFMQSGRNIVAAGYAVYGAKTSFVYSAGNGVHGFTLDPSIGEFVLTEDKIVTPERGSIYSVNEGYFSGWSKPVQDFVTQMKSENKELNTPYTLRYVGSLVADFDRTLRKGGIFLYPPDSRNTKGKLRLLYECMPLAFIAEQAGGRAINANGNIVDIIPKDIHERCPFISGSKYEVDWFERMTNR
jgi:fructose-1,6-bisphosphatase I